MSALASIKNFSNNPIFDGTEHLETPLGNIIRRHEEFWTSKQRQMHSLHYTNSYRASFKPELPDFFIKRFSKEGDRIGDPFGGRGTTALQAAILNRKSSSNDVNPLSERLTYPKLNPVSLKNLQKRLSEIDLNKKIDLSKEEDMSMFYHSDTYKELLNLRKYLKKNRDDIDRFIEMTAISRLHGHSNGFFSAYSFPQISIPKANQAKINQTRGEEPEYREIKSKILKKAATSLKSGGIEQLRKISKHHILSTGDSRDLADWESESVDLIVTSPPFLNQVDYVQDTWIETWFCNIPKAILENSIVQTASLDTWIDFISDTLKELHRVVTPDGYVAMEVGEVKYQGSLLNLDEIILYLCCSAKHNFKHFRIKEIFVQTQQFTKLANCFKVKNNKMGTNTNRIVLMQKK